MIQRRKTLLVISNFTPDSLKPQTLSAHKKIGSNGTNELKQMWCDTKQTPKKFQTATQMHNFTSFSQDNFNLLTQLNKLLTNKEYNC